MRRGHGGGQQQDAAKKKAGPALQDPHLHNFLLEAGKSTAWFKPKPTTTHGKGEGSGRDTSSGSGSYRLALGRTSGKGKNRNQGKTGRGRIAGNAGNNGLSPAVSRDERGLVARLLIR
jgi:hypothetical protein